MKDSLPTISDPTQYDQQIQHNNQVLNTLLDQLFPNLIMPHENVYQILQYLDQTLVNPEVIPRVIRSVQNIILGTGHGEVLIHVRKDIMTVEARERDINIKTKHIDTKI